MGYSLGIDVGTTFTAAAVMRSGRPEMAVLGTQSAAVPTMLHIGDDLQVLVGEAARRRLQNDPARVAREFKRRLGDATPLFVGGVPRSGESLMAMVLRWVVDRVTEQEGSPPDKVVVTHPANWGPFRRELLENAIRQADIPTAATITEPEAAAISYAATSRIEPGQLVAVYDLGGGTFDAAILRKTVDGFELVGSPEGIEHLGGIDVDDAVLQHVRRALGGAVEALDPDDPNTMRSLQRLREECTQAKEALSFDAQATVPVLLPNVHTEVVIQRSELEAMIRPLIADTVAAMRRALATANVQLDDVGAFVLVGGSSRIPLVAELITTELGRPVAVDTQPKHAVALGAAIAGASTDTVAVPPPPPGAPEPAPLPPLAQEPEPSATEPVAVVPEAEPEYAASGLPPVALPEVDTQPVPPSPFVPPTEPAIAGGDGGGEPPKRKVGVLVAVALAAIVAVVLGITLLGGGDDGTDVSSSSPTTDAAGAGADDTTTTTTTSTTESTDDTTDETATTLPGIGQPLLPSPEIETSASADSEIVDRIVVDPALGFIYAPTYDLRIYDLVNLAPHDPVSFEETGVDTGLALGGNGLAYFGVDEGGIFAVDATTLATVWSKRDLGPVYATPVVIDGGATVLVVTETGQFVGLNGLDGTVVLGPYDLGSPMYHAPVVVDRTAIIAADEEVKSVNLDTGEENWRYPVDSFFVDSAAVADGMVYALTDSLLVSIDLESGIVQQEVENPSGYPATIGPVVAEGRIYWGTGAEGNGELLSATIPDLDQSDFEIFYSGGPIRTLPLVSDGVVYFGSEDGNVYAIRASNGEWLWLEELGGAVASGMAIDGNRLFASDQDRLYSILLPEVPPG